MVNSPHFKYLRTISLPMTFHKDIEGISYLGNHRLVIVSENNEFVILNKNNISFFSGALEYGEINIDDPTSNNLKIKWKSLKKKNKGFEVVSNDGRFIYGFQEKQKIKMLQLSISSRENKQWALPQP